MPESEIDVTSIAADIAASIAGPAPAEESGGGADHSGEGASPSVSPEPVSAAPASSPAAAPASPAAPLAADMPKSWKKELAAHWGQLSPEVRQYVIQREEQATSAISGYKPHAESWQQFIQPFQQIFAQRTDVNPVQLAQQLMQGHIALLQAPPEQRVALMHRYLQHYGIEPQALLSGQPNPLADRLRSIEQALYKDKLDSTTKSVTSFFADSKNKYASELEGDILSLIQSGKAPSLEEAYEMAVWLNPATRAKAIAAQQADAAATQQADAAKAANVRKLNVGARDHSRPASGKKLTINDTIDAVVAKNYGGGH